MEMKNLTQPYNDQENEEKKTLLQDVSFEKSRILFAEKIRQILEETKEEEETKEKNSWGFIERGFGEQVTTEINGRTKVVSKKQPKPKKRKSQHRLAPLQRPASR